MTLPSRSTALDIVIDQAFGECLEPRGFEKRSE